MTLKSLVMDRRAFLSGAGLTAGAVMATSLVPLSVVHALPAQLSVSAAVGPAGGWHVDDICGHWPPYAHPIGYGHPVVAPSSLTAYADPVDHMFLV
jgi:hypothetical protein